MVRAMGWAVSHSDLGSAYVPLRGGSFYEAFGFGPWTGISMRRRDALSCGYASLNASTGTAIPLKLSVLPLLVDRRDGVERRPGEPELVLMQRKLELCTG